MKKCRNNNKNKEKTGKVKSRNEDKTEFRKKMPLKISTFENTTIQKNLKSIE